VVLFRFFLVRKRGEFRKSFLLVFSLPLSLLQVFFSFSFLTCATSTTSFDISGSRFARPTPLASITLTTRPSPHPLALAASAARAAASMAKTSESFEAAKSLSALKWRFEGERM